MTLILKFKGQDYPLPENRAFEAGEAIEEIATLPEVISWSRKPKFVKLARCFAAMLEVAGCRATPQEVHAEMMAGFKAGNPGAHLAAISALVAILMDGAPKAEGGEADPGKAEAAS